MADPEAKVADSFFRVSVLPVKVAISLALFQTG